MTDKSDDTVPRTLDDAWKAAEEALPKGWRIERLERDGQDVEFIGGRRERIDWWVAEARGPFDERRHAYGAWPFAALVALAERLSAMTTPLPELVAE